MPRDPRYDVLFEPVRIGPVTAPNRFYQVPHCSGMGYRRPNSLAAMREMKAEGGWGVVCTEYCSIHPTSDDEPLPSSSLWDDEDVRAQAEMVDAVHRHGALAGAELWYSGASVIRHAVHASSGGEAESYLGFRSYLSARNSVLYARRYGSAWQQLRMAAAILATLPFQVLRRAMRGQSRGVRMKLRGWRDALAGNPLPLEDLGLRRGRQKPPG